MRSSLKVTLLGESGTGKSTIAFRMVRNIFTTNLDSTIGASFMTMTVDGTKYEIWDTAGQERYLALIPMYYRGANIIMLVYDVSNPETIERLTYYFDKLNNDLVNDFKLIVIGNKIDLIGYDRDNLIYGLEGRMKNVLSKYSKLYDNTYFITISVKTGENFDNYVNLMGKIGTEIMERKSIDRNQQNIMINEDVSQSKFCSCDNPNINY